MAKLLSTSGKEICVLTRFQTAGAIGPLGTSFSAHATFDDAMIVGHGDEPVLLIEHEGRRYNATVQKTSSVARDGAVLGTIAGKVWPL